MSFWISRAGIVVLTVVRRLNTILAQDQVMSDGYFAFSSLGCKNIRSKTFCKRFARFCAYSDDNGKYMRTNCRFRCGCVF